MNQEKWEADCTGETPVVIMTIGDKAKFVDSTVSGQPMPTLLLQMAENSDGIFKEVQQSMLLPAVTGIPCLNRSLSLSYF